MSLHILHIANYYIGSKVYTNLVTAIDSLNIQQTIYSAFIGNQFVGSNEPTFKNSKSRIIYRPILNNYTRINYFRKTKKITSDILQQVYGEKYDLIHAHTLFSDGKVAYNLHRKFDIPFIVAIRSTDLNFFFRYFPHLRYQAKRTLLAAQKIIFISEAYKNKLLNLPYFSKHQNELTAKSIVIPNGIDNFWIKHALALSHTTHNVPSQLLYVGQIIKRKKLLSIMKVVVKLTREKINFVLHIVGKGSGKYYKRVIQFIEKYPGTLIYHGPITEKQELLDLYKSSDLFVMPSKNETFGLVFVEALSQGLPILYTKNDGVDGFFSPKHGEAVDCTDEQRIENGILKIIENYGYYSFNPNETIKPFMWNTIAKKYTELYYSLKIDNY